MANDAYEVYFAEKLWELIPAIYRHEDGLADNPGTLRAIVELVAEQAARLRRSQDRLWDDSFIEFSDQWAAPYIADLVATRPLSALNPRGQRIDVAKSIYYRRRKGTPRILEELIVDITGWEGVLREGFRRVARARHRLDPAPSGRLIGRFTGTPQGGVADLRCARAAEMSGGPFTEFAHTPDLRRPGGPPEPGHGLGGLPGRDRHRGTLATAGIRKVGFHIWRLSVLPLSGVRPALVQGTTGFTFDPSGRDVPLFQRAAREKGGSQGIQGTGFAEWFEAAEWEVPARMRCRVLGHADYVVSEAALAELASEPGFGPARLEQLRGLVGHRLGGIGGLRRAVGLLPDGGFFTGATPLRAIRAACLVSDCGKAVLMPGSIAVTLAGGTDLARQHVAAGALAQWSAPSAGFRAVIDPERGRLRFSNAPAAATRVAYQVGMPGPVGAATRPRPVAAARTPDTAIAGGGAITSGDLAPTGVFEIADSDTYDVQPNQTAVRNMVLQGADGERPYLRRGADWVLASAQDNANLVLDGLWLGATAAMALRLRGSYATVRLHDLTLDPGGARASDPGAPELPRVRLVVTGEIDRLEIERSILGAVQVMPSGSVNRLVLRDSIVQAPPGALALDQRSGETILERVTVIGAGRLHRLYATETILAGEAAVNDVQTGCFRYGATLVGNRLPRQYRTEMLTSFGGLFASTRFGDPDYGQLSLAAAEGVRRGAENRSEMGAFSSVNAPIRLDGLRQKAAEYMPFGLVPHFIAES